MPSATVLRERSSAIANVLASLSSTPGSFVSRLLFNLADTPPRPLSRGFLRRCIAQTLRIASDILYDSVSLALISTHIAVHSVLNLELIRSLLFLITSILPA